MPELNVELVKRVRQHIFDHPENFDMGGWFYGPGVEGGTARVLTEESLCHTRACLAGTAIALVAAEQRATFNDVVSEYGRGGDRCQCGDPDCDYADIGLAGEALLGLDEGTAGQLFYGHWADRYNRQGQWQGAMDLLDDLAAGNPVL